jgi:hypothetical protein
LQPVAFFDLNAFFLDLPIKELVEVYGFADGIPEYINKIQLPFWEWLDGALKRDLGFFRDEVEFLLLYEFDAPSTYKLILEAIALGKVKLNDIKMHLNLPRTDLSPYLRNLIAVDLIKREVPLTETANSRHGRYFLKDNFLKFWFRYIYPNLSSLEAGLFDVTEIQASYSQYIGPIFDEVAKQYLGVTGIFPCNQIGRWWWKDVEIDIVALSETRLEALFCECKWEEQVDALAILKRLSQKVLFFQWNLADRQNCYAIFAQSFARETQEFEGVPVFCIDLTKMEEALSK